MFSQFVPRSSIGLIVLALFAVAMAKFSHAEDLGLTGVWKDRSPERRAQLAREYGGTAASEAAVSAALDWIARHQSEDGGWSFEYRQAACDQSCQHVGTMKNARNAAIDQEPFGQQAGRLYVTALSALTLEVYYRYPPQLRVE